MKTFFRLFSLSMLVLICLPDAALASGISEFTTPLQRVMETITGPAGRIISVAAFGIAGVTFILNRNELSEGFKILLGVVMGISFIAFAGSIVEGLFTFEGAVI